MTDELDIAGWLGVTADWLGVTAADAGTLGVCVFVGVSVTFI